MIYELFLCTSPILSSQQQKTIFIDGSKFMLNARWDAARREGEATTFLFEGKLSHASQSDSWQLITRSFETKEQRGALGNFIDQHD